MGEHKFNRGALGGPPKPIITLNPIAKPYPKFVHFEYVFTPKFSGLIALDERGTIWLRQPANDGSKDEQGSPRVVWIVMEDARCTMTVSSLVEPA